METKVVNFIGIDVSKLSFDVSIILDGNRQKIDHYMFANSKLGLKDFNNLLVKQLKVNQEETLYCMEYTGIYTAQLLEYFQAKSCKIWMEMAINIKQSLGMVRGKSDKVDSQRIALYAYKNWEEAILWKPKREIIVELKELLNVRDRLIQAKNGIEVPIKEYKNANQKKMYQLLYQSSKTSIIALEKNIKEVNKQIDVLIQSDQKLAQQVNLISSIPSVGRQTATEIIIATNEFQDISEGKKLACYAGVAPFKNESGNYKGKARVHKMANKSIKKLLHMCSLVAIQKVDEFKEYYQRKVKEGKNKMSVLNAIRNKLVLRICAVIKNNEMYQTNYKYLVDKRLAIC